MASQLVLSIVLHSSKRWPLVMNGHFEWNDMSPSFEETTRGIEEKRERVASSGRKKEKERKKMSREYEDAAEVQRTSVDQAKLCRCSPQKPLAVCTFQTTSIEDTMHLKRVNAAETQKGKSGSMILSLSAYSFFIRFEGYMYSTINVLTVLITRAFELSSWSMTTAHV